MKNPIKQLRESHNITQQQLATEASTSTLAVLRYEQGLYDEPSQKIVTALAVLTDTPPTTLTQAYHEWRRDLRQENSIYFENPPPLSVRPDEHPFVTFRKTITTRAVGKDSRMAFCILLAIHPSKVSEYEKGMQAHIPRLILDSLIDVGLKPYYIEGLDQLGVVYHDRTFVRST
jgi:transcriptional regulator with XRE-family HTH domain